VGNGTTTPGTIPIVLVTVALALSACSPDEATAPDVAPTRGYILISIDTLRADHLGAYGYERPTSPFLDSLAEQGTMFEHAIVQLPGTLPSHMSIFTGLYPAEHQVYPHDAVLAPEIQTLPERFREAGYRTGGFTEGGFVSGSYGFARGFDVFSDEVDRTPRDFETTLDRARAFLDSLDPSDRYFLFIHTYSVHDPYDPVEPYRSMFWQGEPVDTFAPTGPNLVEVNRGTRELSAEGLEYFEALYDGGIRYVDDRLGEFWQELADRGMRDDVTLIVTSDHGEEFFEHGMLVHEQVYLETLRVPLLVVHPQLGAGVRVGSLVESVDIAPTLYSLAGFDEQPPMSGESLVGRLAGQPDPAHSDAYAEAFAAPTKTLLWQDEGLYQILVTERMPEARGQWGTPSVAFDWGGGALELQLRSFYQPREVTVSVDGSEHRRLEVGTEAIPLRLELPDQGRRVITLSASSCDTPAEVGVNEDTRCLSFHVSGAPLLNTELYDLAADPRATVDVATDLPDVYDLLLAALQVRSFGGGAAPGSRELDENLVRRLRALGYLR
jgi:arylsulfatase A-like enzyme